MITSPLRLALGIAAIALQVAGQSHAAPRRAESERAIRMVLRDVTIATLKADAETVRAHSTQRTLGLYDLLFSILKEVPGAKDQMAKVGVKNGADFFANSLKGAVAGQKIDAEPMAKKNAETSIIKFLSATEATVEIPDGGSMRAVWEANSWKLDNTDSAKQSLLQSPMVMRLSAGQRKRLENY